MQQGLYRDILRDRSTRRPETIARGNTRAHDRDAIADAQIFVDGTHKDSQLMHIIYEMSAEEVLQVRKVLKDEYTMIAKFRAGGYRNYGSLALLDDSATLRWRNDEKLPEDVVV